MPPKRFFLSQNYVDLLKRKKINSYHGALNPKADPAKNQKIQIQFKQ